MLHPVSEVATGAAPEDLVRHISALEDSVILRRRILSFAPDPRVTKYILKFLKGVWQQMLRESLASASQLMEMDGGTSLG